MLNLFNKTPLGNKQGQYFTLSLLFLPILLLLGLEPKLEIAIASLFFYALIASYFSFAAMLTAAVLITTSLSLFGSVYIAIFAALIYLVLAIPINQLFKKKNPIKTPLADKVSWQIEGLSDIISNAQIRDFDTQDHSERVAQNSLILAKYMSLSEKQTKLLYWSALLHDIGKESIPVDILQKTSTLSVEEFEIVKNHANYGADVLASISPDYGEIAEVVRYHHEKWDGSGYPKKLLGREIPILSRIIAVADVFEALTSKRSYKKPMRAVDAAKYIVNHSASHFDPQIVKVFEICFAQKLLQVADANSDETVDLLYDSQVTEEFGQPVLELK